MYIQVCVCDYTLKSIVRVKCYINLPIILDEICICVNNLSFIFCHRERAI